MVVADLLFGNPWQPTIGASGAIYGLLLAFGMLFPEQEILVMFLFPIKAKYMVMIFGAIAFVFSFQRGSTVSNLAHLGGMIFGFVYIKTQFGARRKATVRLRSQAAMEGIQTAARAEEVQGLPEEARVRRRALGELKR